MKYILLTLFSLIFVLGNAQGNSLFKDEVDALQKKYDKNYTASQETIVFTGSSSIRKWVDVDQRFPDQHIVNTGFGGSQASDLLDNIYSLILRFNPKKIFIYEGDNDIFAKKRPNKIRGTVEEIIDVINRNDSNAKVVIIAAKPSIARWNLKGKYKRLNRKFERVAENRSIVEYADVWKPMLDGKKVKQDLFIEDGLHMNAKGYQIWYDVLKPYVE